MKDLSVVIPVRIDNDDRLENLETSLRFLVRNFPGSEILVVEDDLVPQTARLLERFPTIRVDFERNTDRFSRASVANRGLRNATCPIAAVWDLDVLIKASAVKSAASRIRSGKETIVLPHNTFFVNVDGATKKRLVHSLDPSIIPHVWHRKQRIDNDDLRAHPILSGIIMFDRAVILAEGGFNQEFKSYGWEDCELLRRMNKLGYYTKIIGGANIVHLNHARGVDSRPNELTQRNRQIHQMVSSMTRRELENYVERYLAEPENFDFRRKKRRAQLTNNIVSFRFARNLLDRAILRILTRYV
jgi:hypothetical protein